MTKSSNFTILVLHKFYCYFFSSFSLTRGHIVSLLREHIRVLRTVLHTFSSFPTFSMLASCLYYDCKVLLYSTRLLSRVLYTPPLLPSRVASCPCRCRGCPPAACWWARRRTSLTRTRRRRSGEADSSGWSTAPAGAGRWRQKSTTSTTSPRTGPREFPSFIVLGPPTKHLQSQPILVSLGARSR